MYYVSPEEAKNTRYYLDPDKYKSGLPEEFIKVSTDEGIWWINKSKLKSINIVSIDTNGFIKLNNKNGALTRTSDYNIDYDGKCINYDTETSGINSFLSKAKIITSDGLYRVFVNFVENLTGSVPDLSNITSVGYSGLQSTFYGCACLTGQIPDLAQILVDNGCTSFYSEAISATFGGRTKLTGNVSDYRVSKVTEARDYEFEGQFIECTGLTGDVYFMSLDSSKVTITGTSPSTNPFYRCFYQCTGIDSVHFPASLTDEQKSYLTKEVLFGGTSTTYCKSSLQILFDL